MQLKSRNLVPVPYEMSLSWWLRSAKCVITLLLVQRLSFGFSDHLIDRQSADRIKKDKENKEKEGEEEKKKKKRRRMSGRGKKMRRKKRRKKRRTLVSVPMTTLFTEFRVPSLPCPNLICLHSILRVELWGTKHAQDRVLGTENKVHYLSESGILLFLHGKAIPKGFYWDEGGRQAPEADEDTGEVKVHLPEVVFSYGEAEGRGMVMPLGL